MQHGHSLTPFKLGLTCERYALILTITNAGQQLPMHMTSNCGICRIKTTRDNRFIAAGGCLNTFAVWGIWSTSSQLGRSCKRGPGRNGDRAEHHQASPSAQAVTVFAEGCGAHPPKPSLVFLAAVIGWCSRKVVAWRLP